MRLGFGRIALVLAALLIGVVLLGCSGPGATQPAPRPASAAASAIPASFRASTLTINPTEALAGVQVMITARVTNTGASKTNYTPKLRIDNLASPSLPTYLYLRDAALDAGATQQFSFVVSTENPGKYRVTWDELAGEFVVVENVVEAGTSAANVTAPDFTGVDVVTGKKISLSQFKGKAILFNFVNYGCDPSVNGIVSRQLLAIKQLQKQRSDFIPVSVFCGCCPPEVLRSFATENGFSWPWILDSDNSVARKYTTYIRRYGYPTLVFIDQEQYVRDVAGFTDLAGLSAKIDSLVGPKS